MNELVKTPDIIQNGAVNVNQTYSYINNSGFYALANPVYFNYYYRFARRFGWWYDGWVPDFHSQENGIFSTNLAHTLVDGIANHIIGKRILLQSGDKSEDRTLATKTLKKAYKWADEINLTQVLRTATKYAGALSTSLLKANISNGGIWLEALRFDNFFFETDFRGKLVNVTCLINSYTNTNAQKSDKMDNYGVDNHYQRLDDKYYLVEKRYFKEVKELVNGVKKTHKVPYVIYQVHNYKGNITNAESWDLSLRQNYEWGSIPEPIKKSIHRDFGAIKIGEEQRLPFNEYLGCELIRYNGDDGSFAQQPFGESILKNIIFDLMDYDYCNSSAFRDVYQGKGIVFIAKELMTASAGETPYNGLDDSMVVWLSSLQQQGKLPIEKVQFDLRVEEWRAKLNSIYERIATKLGISPSSIASYLTDNSARTAKEVGTEASDTDNYIDIQRGCLIAPFNRMMKCVSGYNGWGEEIEIRFAKAGSQNIDTIIDRVIKLQSAGLISQKDALREVMIDADEWEVDEAYKNITEQQESLFGSMDINSQGDTGYGTKEDIL